MKTHPLPKGILASDVAPRSYSRDAWKKLASDDYGHIRFELWYTERFGWCILTLGIGGKGDQRRSYAVAVESGQLVTIGNGPHVLERHEVYVKKARLAALKKFIEIKNGGSVKANDCRDRISTRRANTVLRRRSWSGGL